LKLRKKHLPSHTQAIDDTLMLSSMNVVTFNSAMGRSKGDFDGQMASDAGANPIGKS
jgi:hypothetical protein